MASTVLGKVCITNKGAWSGTATYAILDVVTANGSSYLAKTAVPAGTQVTNTTYWQLIAAKGDKGNTGEITGASATINDSFGTPSVTVTPGGTSTERTFAFSFSNLKGNGIESIEKTGTSGAVDTYTITFSDGTTTTFDVTNGSVTSVDGKTGAVVLDDKANIDGYYVDLTAGSSEQLLSTVQIEDRIPYNLRTSGSSADIGNRLTDKIVGGTICWNQLVQNGDFSYGKDNWIMSTANCTVSDGIATVTSTSGSGGLVQNISITAGHKYLVCTNVSLGDADFIASVRFNQQDINIPRQEGWQSIRRIIIGDKTKNNSIYFRLQNGGNTLYVGKTNTFDLTQMFGATIADYIYSLEQSTAGAGVAWFNNLFPKDYYAYNAGEMLSVNAASHDMVGFNAYDNASGKAKLVGGMEYQITGAYTALAYSTGETITPDANGKFTPGENGELTVTGGNATDTCVHLVWDGEKDGEFEEYIKHSYPLDSSLTLRGVPMLDANNKLYYDGDTYESDGTVTRRYGIVDLGTLTWAKSAGGNMYSAAISDMLVPTVPPYSARQKGIICSKYTIDTQASPSPSSMTDKTMLRGSGNIYIMDNSYTGKETFKAAMSGVYLVYELATPTTETADPFTNPQIVDDFGTEEYVDYAYSQGTRDVAIPVGHDTLYMNNLRAKLEMSPDSPDGDGDYIVRQSGGENVYVPLTKELPAAPSEDGNYVLKVTVSDGTPTYSWEVQA